MMKYNKYNKRRSEQPQGNTVEVRNGNVEKAIKVLKKKLLKDGLFQEIRDRQFFESKGTKRRKAKDAATRRFKRKMQKRFEEQGY